MVHLVAYYMRASALIATERSYLRCKPLPDPQSLTLVIYALRSIFCASWGCEECPSYLTVSLRLDTSAAIQVYVCRAMGSIPEDGAADSLEAQPQNLLLRLGLSSLLFDKAADITVG